jgi:hypothetical protein
MGYPVSDTVMKACRHGATIARLKFNGLERGLIPDAASESATVSFIKVKGKTYALTAHHVIEVLDRLAMLDGSRFEGYACVQAPGVAIGGPFLRPPADYPYSPPDIAICPVHERLPAQINKTPFEVYPEDDATWPVTHAVAVGFPTLAKRDTQDEQGRIRLALPCVHALAEGLDSSDSSDQVQFHSEIEEKPGIVSLSGMSGGPVFWSDGTRSGLIGFVKEALDITSKEGESLCSPPRVNFICQRVDFATMERWAQYVDANWAEARRARAVDEHAPGG